MKNKKNFWIILTNWLIIVLVFTSSVTVFASESDNIDQVSSQRPVNSANTIENTKNCAQYTLQPSISCEKFYSSEKVELSFDDTNVVSYNYIAEGINVARHLDANVDYFVVVCLYDPASITSGESVTLSISRE